MTRAIPKTMKAAAIDHFGSADEIKTQTVSVPKIASNEVLIKVEYAGVGIYLDLLSRMSVPD